MVLFLILSRISSFFFFSDKALFPTMLNRLLIGNMLFHFYLKATDYTKMKY